MVHSNILGGWIQSWSNQDHMKLGWLLNMSSCQEMLILLHITSQPTPTMGIIVNFINLSKWYVSHKILQFTQYVNIKLFLTHYIEYIGIYAFTHHNNNI